MRESFEQKTLNWVHQWLLHAQKEQAYTKKRPSSSLIRTHSLERWAIAFYQQHQQEIQTYLQA